MPDKKPFLALPFKPKLDDDERELIRVGESPDLGDLAELGETPVPPMLAPDPTGESDIFLATGVMPFDATPGQIHEYVAVVAYNIGEVIRRNRGNPRNAHPRNMLSVEEKAVVILGRAIGVTWREIKKKINNARIGQGLEPPDRETGSYYQSVIEPHKKIVAAIHTDILDALEVFSPLVSGTSRIIWRARIMEFYRQRIHAISRQSRLKVKEREQRIIALDKAMSAHVRYFDSLQNNDDIERALGSPADQVQIQVRSKAEREIEDKFDKGEITDAERIDLLREARHGDRE